MYRYIAFVWNPRNAEGARARECIDRLAQPWSVAYEGPGILALHVQREAGTATSHRLPGRAGVVLGQLFERRCENYATAHDVTFDEAQAANVVDSGGQHLIDHYWGSYLAILFDAAAQRHHVFSDPIGILPCYRAQHGGMDIFFSRLEDCLQLVPLPLRINRRHLTHWLLFSSVRTNDTGVEGVTRLGAGERLTLSPTGATFTRLWDPTAIASRANLHDPSEAASALRAAVQNTVNAWASRYRRITHKVSGGLDSAIIAGCLAHAPSSPNVTYLNMVADAGKDQPLYLPGMDAKTAAKVRTIAMHGDERYYARQVAQRWNISLLERPRQASMDLARLEQVPLGVAPSMYFTVVEMDDAELELIGSHGTQAFFSGQAGDALFLAAQRPFGAFDHAYLHGLSRDLWRQIVMASALSRDSLWSVITKTLKHGVFRNPYTARMKLLDRPTLLTQERFQTLREADLQSSFSRRAAQSTLPPGKQDHIKGIASAFHHYIFHAGERADHIDPLNSQPVWETALQIPTYTLLAGGVSRGLARRAFADLLPEQIRKRIAKGTGSRFYQQVVRHNKTFMLERLESGLLVREGYLDRRKVVDCLRAEAPWVTMPPSILLAYVAAESWLQRMHSATPKVSGIQAPAMQKTATG